jgi:energy-coupling factor transporter ATP-binding protein EcfA2
MALLADVLAWSDDQAMWVRDGLRRIFGSDVLSADDYDRVFDLLLNDQGAPFDPPLVGVPLQEDHLPATPAAGVTTVAAMSQMRNVNRFPADSAIQFGNDGLTIVYGENGSGKSGLARVLKQVCRARKRDPVLGDAYAANFAQQVPQATLHYFQDGQARQFDWSMAHQAPTGLQSVAVFDGSCALDYVTSEGDAAFQPFGLGQLEMFASTLVPELSRRTQRQINDLDVDGERFGKVVPGTTQVGAIVANISAQTKMEELRRLGAVSAGEQKRLQELIALLEEENVEPKAASLEGLATRLLAVHQLGVRARAFVTDHAIGRARSFVETHDSAVLRRNEAEALLQDDVLLGTGSDTWRTMFLAAKAFSTRQAYPEHEAPFLGQGAKCVLCQTEMDATAIERMTAFNAFVISEAATEAETAHTVLVRAHQSIDEADLSIPVDEALAREMAADTPELLDLLANARREFADRRKWMAEQRVTKGWLDPPPLSHEPGFLSRIEAKAARMTTLAASYRAAVDAGAHARLVTERDELQSRVAIGPHIDAIAGVVTSFQEKAILESCKAALASNFVSRQIGVLAGKYITDALAADMVAELKELGVLRIAHALRKRVDHGKTMMSIALEGTAAKVAAVLSEGEQRVTAFALFLAELHQSGSRSALIVDDPVSSLDHHFRQRVANRLVGECKQRQVIVLTHDAVFLNALLTRCERERITPVVQTIGWNDGAPGHVENGLPWMNMSLGERIAVLKAEQVRMATTWGDHPSEDAKREMAEVYARTRGTMERVVRESILNKAVRPFDDRVQIERVAALPGFSEKEFDALNAVYLRCNYGIDAHDSSGEGMKEVPTPDELAADIATLELLISNASARASKQRKSAAIVEKGTRREWVG